MDVDDQTNNDEVSHSAGATVQRYGRSSRRRDVEKLGVAFGVHDPIRLKTAARIKFPDGSVSEPALRAALKSGRLMGFKVNGKYLTTLDDVERFKSQCRVTPKDLDSGFGTHVPQNRDELPKKESLSSSAMDAKLARDAALMTARRLRESLLSSSSKGTRSRGEAAQLKTSRSVTS